MILFGVPHEDSRTCAFIGRSAVRRLPDVAGFLKMGRLHPQLPAKPAVQSIAERVKKVTATVASGRQLVVLGYV